MTMETQVFLSKAVFCLNRCIRRLFLPDTLFCAYDEVFTGEAFLLLEHPCLAGILLLCFGNMFFKKTFGAILGIKIAGAFFLV